MRNYKRSLRHYTNTVLREPFPHRSTRTNYFYAYGKPARFRFRVLFAAPLRKNPFTKLRRDNTKQNIQERLSSCQNYMEIERTRRDIFMAIVVFSS